MGLAKSNARPDLLAVSLGDPELAFARTADALDRSGFAIIEGAITADWLARAQADVTGIVAAHDAKFLSLIGPGDEPSSVFAEVAHDPGLTALLERLVRHAAASASIDPGGPYNVLRVIAGRSGTAGAYQFHYDASVVTAVVPIFIPENPDGPAGQLAVLPNRRRLRSSMLYNLIEKVALQNRFSWARARKRVSDNPAAHVKQLKVGNIYLFWGYRTLHGNLPCGVDALRTTLLLHLGDPHGNALATRVIRSLRARIEARRRAA